MPEGWPPTAQQARLLAPALVPCPLYTTATLNVHLHALSLLGHVSAQAINESLTASPQISKVDRFF